ncbi:MAG: hypothetical protein M1376_12140 [Planctomycetes bacterium]|nr:hypothetical protein [Planctomycetota bacterium]
MAATKLTPEVVSKLEYYWQLASDVLMSDEEICARVGIKCPTLKKALQRDQKVLREDGTRESIVSLRARAKAGMIAGYLQRHFGLLLKAETAGDLRTAHQILCWLEMKQMPERFYVEPHPAQERQNKTGYVEGPGTAPNSEQWEKENKPKPETPTPPTTT